MSNANISYLQAMARQLRIAALTMIYEAQSGHPGGSFSAADIVAALYFHDMRIEPKNPNWAKRDRFILSKGHVCPILYAALGIKGYFEEAHLHTLRQEDSILQGHPDMKKCPGIDISTGSLGQGLACGVGMALAAKRDKLDYMVYVMVGDGEMNEGEVWEAIMCAYKYRLDNLVIILDNNGLQLDGTTDEVMPLLDMNKKMDAFGYDTYRIDGHDMEGIVETLDSIRANKNGNPKFINALTVKGKGVDYMENQLDWHGLAPNKEQFDDAIAQLERS